MAVPVSVCSEPESGGHRAGFMIAHRSALKPLFSEFFRVSGTCHREDLLPGVLSTRKNSFFRKSEVKIIQIVAEKQQKQKISLKTAEKYKGIPPPSRQAKEFLFCGCTASIGGGARSTQSAVQKNENFRSFVK